MTEQWQELKETIIELRDNDGTGTQQEVCKFLINLMDILEKQMQEPCEDCISRQAVLDMIKAVCFSREQVWIDFRVSQGSNGQRDFIIKFIESLPSIQLKQKTGHWYRKHSWEICFTCSECGTTNASGTMYNYCPSCGSYNGGD